MQVDPIVSNAAGSFPWHVWHDRHPALIAQICDAHPYPGHVVDALHALVDETLTGTMRPLRPDAHDAEAWYGQGGERYSGRPWLDAPFLWAESYFYRRLLDAVDFFGAGPWAGVDPFAFLKRAELRGAGLDGDLAALDGLAGLPPGGKTRVLLHAALWGNRADLGFRIGVAAVDGTLADAANLVADDTPAVLARLAGGARTVCVVADNAGRELIADLVLIDHLLGEGTVERVTLQLKPRPYYVSDATTADLADCVRRLGEAPGAAADAAGRLRTAAADGRLRIAAHPFACAPLSYHDMPADLPDDASLVILKGDLNYRRLVGDRHWAHTTPFAQVAGYFPTAVVALRVLKSDVLVGVDAGTVAALDAGADDWRTNGSYALLQAVLPPLNDLRTCGPRSPRSAGPVPTRTGCR